MKLEFKPDICTTTNYSFVQKRVDIGNNEELILYLWDSIGQEKYRTLSHIYLRNSDCIVLGYDITRRETFIELDYWYKTIKEYSSCNLIYLIGNKVDLYDGRQVNKDEAIQYAELYNLRFFEVSCKTDEGLNIFYNDLVNNILELYIAKNQ